MGKSIWKSKSFLTGVSTLVMAIITGYDIKLPPGVMEAFLALVTLILVGKSAAKRMPGLPDEKQG